MTDDNPAKTQMETIYAEIGSLENAKKTELANNGQTPKYWKLVEDVGHKWEAMARLLSDTLWPGSLP